MGPFLGEELHQRNGGSQPHVGRLISPVRFRGLLEGFRNPLGRRFGGPAVARYRRNIFHIGIKRRFGRDDFFQRCRSLFGVHIGRKSHADFHGRKGTHHIAGIFNRRHAVYARDC